MKIKNDRYRWIEEMQRDEEVKVEVKDVKNKEKNNPFICGEYEGEHFKANIAKWDVDLEPGWYIMKCTKREFNDKNQRWYHYLEFNPVNSVSNVLHDAKSESDPTTQTTLDEQQVREQYGEYDGKQAEDVFPTQPQIREEDTYQSQLSQQMRSEWEKEKQKLVEEQERLHQKQKELNKEKEMIDYILQGGKV